MKKIETKCPKCNAPPEDIKVQYVNGGYYVNCSKCGTYTDTYSRWADSVDAWNRGLV